MATKAKTDIIAILKAITTELASALHSFVQFYHAAIEAGTGLGKFSAQQS